jgi:hypothetical protein
MTINIFMFPLGLSGGTCDDGKSFKINQMITKYIKLYFITIVSCIILLLIYVVTAFAMGYAGANSNTTKLDKLYLFFFIVHLIMQISLILKAKNISLLSKMLSLILIFVVYFLFAKIYQINLF